MQCPLCKTVNSNIYVGLRTVECINSLCEHYLPKPEEESIDLWIHKFYKDGSKELLDEVVKPRTSTMFLPFVTHRFTFKDKLYVTVDFDESLASNNSQLLDIENIVFEVWKHVINLPGDNDYILNINTDNTANNNTDVKCYISYSAYMKAETSIFTNLLPDALNARKMYHSAV